jgi:dolichyl-phosphate-mannose-protein mannosyltransferase
MHPYIVNTYVKKYRDYLIPALILLVSLLVYSINIGSPRAMFWDENYHVASAQKHIDGVMYMEPHPPLGKMLMALGEVVVGANSDVDKSALNRTDYLTGQAAPKDMEYTGFRLPSTVLMALSVLFFYGIVHRITRRWWLAAAFTTLVIFDNALVIHARSAMLEGIQLFFILAAIYYLVRTVTSGKPITLKHYAVLGVLVGLAIAVKLNGAILLLLFVMLFGADQWDNIKHWRWLALFKRLSVTVPAGVLPVLAVFFGIFYVHIATGTEVVGNRTYKASSEYLDYLRKDETNSPAAFITGMKDHWRYMSEYADGVPRLDPCKPGENGSHAMGWPIGKKSINYRWDKNTVDGVVQVRYMQLIGNPVVWLSVLAGVILSVGLLISRFVYGNKEKDAPLFLWISAFTTLYICYMVAILQIDRVMYLYHYLVPLVFGAINLSLVFAYIFRDEVVANNRHTMINAAVFALIVIGVFAFFSPFSYGFALTEDEFALRNWFGFWQLEVVR